ncbi:hypothetical protein MJO29_004111 [Puccinia striiformis f. sp. tritici]|nr:hypothetical protein MJO29_004111 [Puccinia striiformis f. sp. tritici]
MVYRRYDSSTKITTVRMTLQNHSRSFIRQSLGRTISRQSFDRWTQLYHKTQRVVRDPQEYDVRGRHSLLSSEDRDFMIELVRTEPGLFLDKMRERLYDHGGTLVGINTLQQTLVEKLSITLKKPNTVNIRKNLPYKYRWIAKMANVPAEFLVFTGKSCPSLLFFPLSGPDRPHIFFTSATDESGICSRDLLRSFSRSTRGEQASRYQLEMNAPRYSLIPAISYYGVLAMTVVDHTVRAQDFEHYLKWKVLPRMNRYPDVNSVLVMDNAAIHRRPRVARLCRAAGVKLVYLPPYCPELNPIEVCFSQVKSSLRRTQALANAADPTWLIRQTTHDIVSASLCRELYRHAGYHCPPSE